jgi:Leucine-rich repeat (LRR) protein
MVANVKKESYNEVPYVLTTYDVMSLPHEISLLDRLTKLDLRDNFLIGTIPTTIGELRKLRMLNLYGNRITGSIPEELYSIGGLEYLVLGRNSLNGMISTGIAQLTHI